MIDVALLLDQAGVQGIRVGPKEITALCPSPTHNDQHPSWSINRTTLLHQCFACGYRGTLTALLVDLTGAAPVDLEDTLHKESFLRSMEALRERPDETIEPVLPYLTDWSLRHLLGDVPSRLLALRRLQRAAVDAYEVRWDRERRSWVLPLRSPAGELLGAQYKRVGSVLTLPAGLPKSQTLFGWSQVQTFDYAVMVESPLDAVRLFGLGIPAFATLGAWVSREQVSMMARCFAAVYLALDNDDAGRQGAEQATRMLRRARCAAVPWRYDGLTDEEGKPAKDPGDVASDEALLEAWASTQTWGL